MLNSFLYIFISLIEKKLCTSIELISFTMAFCVVYYYIYVAKEVRGVVIRLQEKNIYIIESIFFSVNNP